MRNSGFQFNERDAEIIHYVYQLRIATLDHLAALTGRSHKTLERRLPKLCAERYVRRLKPRPHKGMYVLGTQGIAALIEGGYAARDLADKRLRENEWRDLTIPHALHVSAIHTKLLLLSREGHANLIQWRHDNSEMWDTVETPRDGRQPFRPDAYFVLEHAKRQLHFFLEADVGTMSHAKITLKVKAYVAYHEQQRHLSKYRINSFQVAIVTRSAARAANLRTEIHSGMSYAQRRAYHVVPLEELNLETLVQRAAVCAAILA